jgi:putative transposase
MGLKSFATLSRGEVIDNPRFLRIEEKRLAEAQKKLSAATKGTSERRKARKVAARVHERIANKRKEFAHRLSRYLVSRFGIIVFEKSNIGGMLKNHSLAKSIADAAWKQTIQSTAYKAERAGRFEVEVNPRDTGNTTFCCGEKVDITLTCETKRQFDGISLRHDHCFKGYARRKVSRGGSSNGFTSPNLL